MVPILPVVTLEVDLFIGGGSIDPAYLQKYPYVAPIVFQAWDMSHQHWHKHPDKIIELAAQREGISLEDARNAFKKVSLLSCNEQKSLMDSNRITLTLQQHAEHAIADGDEMKLRRPEEYINTRYLHTHLTNHHP